jgi:hypothetical protein
MFSSYSIPCQGRTTRRPHQYKKWPPEDKKNQNADEGLESGAKTTLCQPRFIGRRLAANSRCASGVAPLIPGDVFERRESPSSPGRRIRRRSRNRARGKTAIRDALGIGTGTETTEINCSRDGL